MAFRFTPRFFFVVSGLHIFYFNSVRLNDHPLDLGHILLPLILAHQEEELLQELDSFNVTSASAPAYSYRSTSLRQKFNHDDFNSRRFILMCRHDILK